MFEDGTTPQRGTFEVAELALQLEVETEFPAARGRRFGAIVESLVAVPAQVVVERAMYWDALGLQWAAGTNALGARLR